TTRRSRSAYCGRSPPRTPPPPVGSFDVRGRGGKPVRIGTLAVPYRGTRAFAVSIGHGRAIPAAPSPPVALGRVVS
ncbi:MAG: hypothetical protein ACRDOL_44590, partial [Streptosporangiaceae bacterium]